MNPWQPRWLILSGHELITMPDTNKNRSMIERRIKQNLLKVLQIYPSREIERFKLLNHRFTSETTMIFTTSDKWRIAVNDIQFSFTTDASRNEWYKAIDHQKNLLKQYYVPVLSRN
jgi:hypothetical protein